MDELHYYDVYAPLVGEVKVHYTYEQAQQMVLDAVAPLGKDYGDSGAQGLCGALD